MRAALLLAALCACGPAPKKDPVMTDSHSADSDDGKLVARVRAGVANQVAPSGLASFVGKPALFDTTAGGNALVLARVDFAADPDHADEKFDRARAKAVVYWARPIASKNPRVVGVQVGDDGASRVFFAEILPPG